MNKPSLVFHIDSEEHKKKHSKAVSPLKDYQRNRTGISKKEISPSNRRKTSNPISHNRKNHLHHGTETYKGIRNRTTPTSSGRSVNLPPVFKPPLPKPEEIERLQKINADHKEKYKNTGAEFDLQKIFNEQPECIPSILQTVDKIDTTTEGYVVVLDVKKNLPAFHKFFKKQPFYVISAEAPEVSYAFSQTINEITHEYRLKKSRTVTELRKKTLDYSREIAQGNAADFYKELQENIEEVQTQGLTGARNIMDELNRKGIRTRQGEEWKIHNFYHAQKQIEKYSNS